MKKAVYEVWHSCTKKTFD